jgi:adenylate cyclase
VKRTGDGSIIEFRSVVDAVRCAIEVQNGMVERNAGLPPERRIEFRVGVHLGDVVEESDGDLMGDGVNIAARLESIAKPGSICLSEDAYRQVKSRLDLAVSDLGAIQLKNIAEPVRVYSLEVGKAAQAKLTKPTVPRQLSLFALLGAGVVALIAIGGSAWYFLSANRPATITSNAPAARADAAHLSIVVLPFTNLSGDPSQDYFADGITENLTTDLSRIRNSFVIARNTAFTFKGKNIPIKEISKELCDMSWKARCSAIRLMCASTPNLSTARPARISGPTGSKKTWLTCSSCKIRWWRDWPIRWAMSWSGPRRKEARTQAIPTLSTCRCAVGPPCGSR